MRERLAEAVWNCCSWVPISTIGCAIMPVYCMNMKTWPMVTWRCKVEPRAERQHHREAQREEPTGCQIDPLAAAGGGDVGDGELAVERRRTGASRGAPPPLARMSSRPAIRSSRKPEKAEKALRTRSHWARATLRIACIVKPRDDRDRAQRHADAPVLQRHHRDDADQQQRAAEDLQHELREEVGERRDVAVHALDDVAGRGGGVEAHVEVEACGVARSRRRALVAPQASCSEK